MKLIGTKLEGVYIIENYYAEDDRGSFTKTYHEEFFSKNKICTSFKESYYSISHKDVIRGMHFQLPPYDHEKIMYVAQGEVTDIVLDLRKSSNTYGKFIEVILGDNNHISVYIPKGLAHGFKANKDNTIMIYNVATIYNQDYDSGIRYDSFGYDWVTTKPKISERDKSLMGFDEFKERNPF